MKRIVRVVVLAVFMVTILVVASVPVFARQKLGHEVPKAVCSTVADKGDSGMFEWRNGKKVCWFTPPA